MPAGVAGDLQLLLLGERKLFKPELNQMVAGVGRLRNLLQRSPMFAAFDIQPTPFQGRTSYQYQSLCCIRTKALGGAG